MNRIQRLAQKSEVRRALFCLTEQKNELVDLIISVQQIPAPTFDEANRAKFIEDRFSAFGLKNVQRDKLNNVFASLNGSSEYSDVLVISAHCDTVFPLKTDLSIKRDGHYLYGPGIGDNATGVAAVLALAKILREFELQQKCDIWFVVNVGEEGLGNLRGMRAVCERFGAQARYIVVEGGSFGQIIHKAIGVKRFRIAINTNGGHSWGSFGEPSAIHEIGNLIAEISRIRVPDLPKTTFNVGVIEGGTSVNSIASSASLLLDLRSEDNKALDQLVGQIERMVRTRQWQAKNNDRNVIFHLEEVGSRPSGSISSNDTLVCLAEEALRHVGWSFITNNSGSTDANIPLSQNIPAICVGITSSGNSHRIDEYIDLTHLEAGMEQLLLLTLAAADY